MKFRHFLIGAMILMIAAPVFARGSRYGYGIKGKIQYNSNQHSGWYCARNDANGDGFCCYGHNDSFGRYLTRDADGDGVPNGRDPDFKRGFVDDDGDGVCDHRQGGSSAPGGSS